MTFGRNVITGTGRDVCVAADTDDIDWKSGGITVDWGTVAAVGSDTTLADDTVILNGQKGLRFGQIMVQITSVVSGSKIGYYGPYDPAATDGRQTLARGRAYILNRTVLQNNPVGLNVHNADNPAVFEGGRAWKARILMTAGSASLAAGPTIAAFETVFPNIVYVQNQ